MDGSLLQRAHNLILNKGEQQEKRGETLQEYKGKMHCDPLKRTGPTSLEEAQCSATHEDSLEAALMGSSCKRAEKSLPDENLFLQLLEQFGVSPSGAENASPGDEGEGVGNP